MNSADLYKILGISRQATKQEIKRAYRQKARDTHPDKQVGKDPAQAADEFRKVVEAYETLSDEKLRRIYDQTGENVNSKNQRNSFNRNDQSGGNGWNWQWNWQFNRKQQRRQHHYLNDFRRRAQILDAQSRVVTIHGINHLISVTMMNDESHGDIELTDRYTLLAFYDSSQPSCQNRLDYEILFPWPFAGFSGEGSEGIWWEEIMFVAKINLNDKNSEWIDLLTFFHIPMLDGTIHPRNCPSIVFIQRGIDLQQDIQQFRQYVNNPRELTAFNEFKMNMELKYPVGSTFQISEEFREWVWPKLKMSVTIVNQTPYVLHQWWLDGMRGVRRDDLEVNGEQTLDTFISHSFYFRANFVEGRTLTNESGLLWYTARLEDDRTKINIYDRCFDRSGECSRWKMEGFCDPNSHTFYTRQNPNFREYARSNCPVSCGFGCDKEEKLRKKQEKLNEKQNFLNSQEAEREKRKLDHQNKLKEQQSANDPDGSHSDEL